MPTGTPAISDLKERALSRLHTLVSRRNGRAAGVSLAGDASKARMPPRSRKQSQETSRKLKKASESGEKRYDKNIPTVPVLVLAEAARRNGYRPVGGVRPGPCRGPDQDRR